MPRQGQETEMEISNLTFIITDDCNFNCSYCFQKKEKKTITHEVIRKAVDFFYPHLKAQGRIQVGFYGGEPLLAFDKIQYAVKLLQEKNQEETNKENKKIQFAVTTNGSLLTDEMLQYFDSRRFNLVLSFDGLAQDSGRKSGTLEQMRALVKRIQGYPRINFEINSVFTPRTIRDFSRSLQYIVRQGDTPVTFNLNTMEEWNAAQLETLEKELTIIADYLVPIYRERGHIPVTNFGNHIPLPGKGVGIFRCSAGSKQMAVTPGGKLWGCYLFHDYFKTRAPERYDDYCYGTLDQIENGYEARFAAVTANYAELRQDYYRVGDNHCFLCGDVEGCLACPLNAAYTGGSLGAISCGNCRLMKIQRNALKNFREKIQSDS